MKLLTKDLVMSPQPSTRTNKRILRGREMLAGGKNMSPKLMRMIATT